MKHPVVEKALQALLGDQFHPASIWAMTLNQLTECDSTEEVDAVMTKAKADFEAGLQPPPPSRPAQAPRAEQLAIAETDLMATIADLHLRKRTSASGMPILEDLVDPEDERDVGNAQFKVQTDAEIVAAVRYEDAVARGNVMEVDSEEEEEDEPEGEPDLTTAEILSLCQKLEKACLTKGQPDQSLLIISVASVQMSNGRSF
jgi:hypothetical protein